MLSIIDVVVPAEVDKPERLDLEKIRYSAHLPWIGPILGPDPVSGEVAVGCAADPRLGNAAAAVFIPVVKNGDRYEPSNPAGQTADLVEVACFKWLKEDEGRFRVHAPASLWQGKADGVLLLLLYERSGRVLHQIGKLDVPAKELPEKMVAPIRALLAEPEEDLELGLIPPNGAQPPDTLTFAVGSCQYPAGFVDRDVAERSYARLRSRLEVADPSARPRCLLLLGDQVYLDATAGLFDPTALYDKYHLPYERLLRMVPLRHVLRRIPAYMMLDDHEIDDNWEPLAGDQKNQDKLDAGRKFYTAYQRIAGPDAPQGLWYGFEVNGFPFFLTDTRTERNPRAVETIGHAHIMGEAQFTALLGWLDTHRNTDKPKFIASSVSLLPRHRRATCSPAGALRSDGWDGYPASLHRLLAAIVETGIRDVVFLSGDEHVSFVTRAVLRRKNGAKVTVIHSVHSAGLYAPYPFANGIDDNLQWDDKFEFPPAGATYSCEVTKCFATVGDGVSVLQVRKDGKEWMLDYRFLRADDPHCDERARICTSR